VASISGKHVFVSCFLLAMAYALCATAYDQRRKGERLHFRNLTAEIAVSEQLTPANIQELKQLGFETVIDLRPDGGVHDPQSSRKVGEVVRSKGMRFFYFPVPDGDIPQAAVNGLAVALSKSDDVLLFCPSSRRAARTWALAEAARPGGLGADAILAAMESAGQPADDLAATLRERVAKRVVRRAMT
jgi:uncharacterized protein (TIGR01244 family)